MPIIAEVPTPDHIVFGTDGWRGVIADDYTFENLRRATQGFASYLLEKGYADRWAVVGHDKRFHSENFAASVAEVLAGNGLNVYLTDGATPTPVRSATRSTGRPSTPSNPTAGCDCRPT